MKHRVATRQSIYFKMNVKTICYNLIIPYFLCLSLAFVLFLVSNELDKTIKSYTVQRTVIIYSDLGLPFELQSEGAVETIRLVQETDDGSIYMVLLESHKSVQPFIQEYTQNGIRVTTFETAQQDDGIEFQELTWFRELLSVLHTTYLCIAYIILVVMVVRELDLEQAVCSDLYLLSFSKMQILYFLITALFRIILFGAVLVILFSLIAFMFRMEIMQIWISYVILSLPLVIIYPLGALKKCF